MAGRYRVYWTYEAVEQVRLILNYLKINWGDKELNDFLDLLNHFEKSITFFQKYLKNQRNIKVVD